MKKGGGFLWNENVSVFPKQFTNIMTDTALFDSRQLVILGGSIGSGCQISKYSSAKYVTRFYS